MIGSSDQGPWEKKRISHGFCLVRYIVHLLGFRDNFRSAKGR